MQHHIGGNYYAIQDVKDELRNKVDKHELYSMAGDIRQAENCAREASHAIRELTNRIESLENQISMLDAEAQR